HSWHILYYIYVLLVQEEVLAIHGRPAVLRCSFDSAAGMDNLVVTWQRVEDNKVVHSFYHGKDQLDLQSVLYKNRTELYNSELQAGNASLMLHKVGPQDEGKYLCTVSTSRGTSNAQVQVKYGALFSEPKLTIKTHGSNITLLYESEGYPEPETSWQDLSQQNVSYDTEVVPSGSDLLTLRTKLTVNGDQNRSYRLTVRNRLLGQLIERDLVFSDVSSRSDTVTVRRSRVGLVCVIFYVSFFTLFIIAFTISQR
uniref:Ig-like domain-containing protein n=1 Tax=Denticeps clupeoides TaxID=299321 RepID=A0AAY4DR77_9TELE